MENLIDRMRASNPTRFRHEVEPVLELRSVPIDREQRDWLRAATAHLRTAAGAHGEQDPVALLEAADALNDIADAWTTAPRPSLADAIRKAAEQEGLVTGVCCGDPADCNEDVCS